MGLVATRCPGRTGGRPAAPTPETIRAVGDMLPEPGENIDSTVKLPGDANNLFHTADLREQRSYVRGLRDRW